MTLPRPPRLPRSVPGRDGEGEADGGQAKNETGIPDSIVGTGSTVTHKRYSVFRIFLLTVPRRFARLPKVGIRAGTAEIR